MFPFFFSTHFTMVEFFCFCFCFLCVVRKVLNSPCEFILRRPREDRGPHGTVLRGLQHPDYR